MTPSLGSLVQSSFIDHLPVAEGSARRFSSELSRHDSHVSVFRVWAAAQLDRIVDPS